MATTGYSKTPLVKKLGLKENHKILLIGQPENYFDLLEALPNGVKEATANNKADFIHFFTKNKNELVEKLPTLKSRLSMTGMLWVSWPKKASKVETDLSDHIVRELGLSTGLVDIKVCAVDHVWSGLKFVFRLEDRS